MDSRLDAVALIRDQPTLSTLFFDAQHSTIQQAAIKRITAPYLLLNMLMHAKTRSLSSDPTLSDFGNITYIFLQISDERTMIDALRLLGPVLQNPVEMGGLLLDLRNDIYADHIVNVIDSPSSLWSIASENQGTLLQEHAITKLERIVSSSVTIEGVTFGRNETFHALDEAGSIEYDQVLAIKMAMFHPLIRKFHKTLRFRATEWKVYLDWGISGSVSCTGTTHDLEIEIYDADGVLFHHMFQGDRSKAPIPEGVTELIPLIIAQGYCKPTYPRIETGMICAALVEPLPQTDLVKIASEPHECLRQAARTTLGVGLQP